MYEKTFILCIFYILGETVVQFKFTVLISATGPARITGLPFDQDMFVSELSIKDPEVVVCLNEYI